MLMFCLLFSLSGINCDSNNNDIVFKLPDIIAEYGPTDGRIILKAYKSSNNDIIIHSDNESNFGKLSWISIGQPKLVIVLNKKNHSTSYQKAFTFTRNCSQMNIALCCKKKFTEHTRYLFKMTKLFR